MQAPCLCSVIARPNSMLATESSQELPATSTGLTLKSGADGTFLGRPRRFATALVYCRVIFMIARACLGGA
jgi:hypothetical protein